MAELQDTDLMLVNRGGKSYKATGAEIKDSLNPSVVTKPQIIAPAEGAGIAIGAESDEIIAVGATSYTAGATSEYMENLDGAFNGILDENEYTAMRPSSNADTSSNPEFTFETPVPFGTLRVWARTPGSGVSPGNIEGKTLSDNSWSQIVPQNNTGMNWFTWSKTNDSLVAIRMRSSTQAAGAAIGAFEVDGNLLLNTTDLTFASNKNLTGDPSFAEGDLVQQDSGYTPTTSVITGYSQESYPDLGAAGNWVGPAASSGANLFNKEPEGTHTGTYVYNTSNATPITWTAPLNGKLKGSGSVFLGWQSRYTGATEYYGTICRITTQAGTFDSAGSTPGGITEVVLGDNYEIEKLEFIGKSGNSYNGGLSWISPTADEASKWYSGMEVTTLTLQDDTDLENFRVGDIVQLGPGIGNYIEPPIFNDNGYTPFSNSGSFQPVNGFDGAGATTHCFPEKGGNWVWTLDMPVTTNVQMNIQVGDTTRNECYVNGTLLSDLVGNINVGTIVTATIPAASIGNKLETLELKTIADGTRFCKLYRVSVDGVKLIDETKADPSDFVYVTGTDSANNKMRVNGGTWNTGETVTGPDTTPATGTVASTDSGANTMLLATSDETFPKRWIVNAGKFVIGEQFPSKNAAPDADGLTLIATDFVDSPYGSLTHGSSDWQVTAFSDTSYSAPVASATGDATNKTTWEVTPTLEEGTRYRARVRYKASEIGKDPSPWSDDTTFETKSNPFAQLEPCNLWQNFGGATSTWGKIVAPAPVINAGQYYMDDGRRNFAICTDGKIYSSAANTANSSADAVMTPPSNPAISGLTDLVNFWGAYQSSNINDWVALKTDGSIVNGQGYTDLDGKKVIGFYPLGPVSRMMLLKTDDNEIWCYSMISNTYNIGSETTSNRGLFKLNIGGFPAGVELVDVVGGTSNNSSGGYDTACLIFLGSDGKIYTSASTESNAINCMSAWGFSATGRNESVYQETTFPANFKALYGGSTYSTEACFSALTEDGDLWFAGLGGNKITNGERAFSLFDDTNKYLSGIVCTYQVTNSYSLRADGKLWGKFQGYVTTGKDYVEIEVPDYNGTLGSLGGICGNINCYGVALPYPAPI